MSLVTWVLAGVLAGVSAGHAAMAAYTPSILLLNLVPYAALRIVARDAR